VKALHALNISDSKLPGLSLRRYSSSDRQRSAGQDRTKFHGDSPNLKFIRMISWE
jgi:hypothetical protein